MRMKWIASLIVIIIVLFFSCKSYKQQKEELTDTATRGTIHVSADESFKPIIDEQVKVYESNHPGTRIIVDYKPEAECLKDMLVDSVRMVIATRRFSPAEYSLVSDSLGVGMQSLIVARDAIAVIMHPDAEERNFTMGEVKEILQGKFKKNLIPVFDGVKATSTVRFIIDSVLRGDTLTAKAMAARSSEAVVDFIAKNKDAVGFIGISWIGNKEDTAQVGFLRKVKLIALEDAYVKGEFVLPAQVTIFTLRYPMVRDLVYILKEKHKGLGHGFGDFMSGDKGQLIFRRAYLVPAKKDFRIRKAQLIE